MVAKTPLVSRILMIWFTGTPNRVARSETLTTDGTSMGPAWIGRAAVARPPDSARRSNASSWPRRPPRRCPGRLAGRPGRCMGRGIGASLRQRGQLARVFSERAHVVLGNDLDLEGAWQDATLECGAPALRGAAQVSPSTGQLAGGVDPHRAGGGADDAHQLTLGLALAARDAGTLRDVPRARDRASPRHGGPTPRERRRVASLGLRGPAERLSRVVTGSRCLPRQRRSFCQ